MAEHLTLPGLFDCHVHFREPGNTEAEDMKGGAEAALAGGITTVCDMPNTQPPTCTVIALEEKIARLENLKSQNKNLKIDIRFFFGVTKQEHLTELEKVIQSEELKKYVPGVKLYLGHSTGNQKVEEGITEEVFQVCSRLGLPVVCHCEDEEVIQRNLFSFSSSNPEFIEGESRSLSTRLPASLEENTEVALHSQIRSVESAVKATTYAISLARTYGTKLHIAHVSTADELTLIRKAKKEGTPVTCEVAPHHLFLSMDDYETLGTLAKTNPPLRTHEHAAALWEGIADGTVDCVASDHAPHTLEEKGVRNPLERRLTPLDAPSGVPGVETMLPLLLSCVYSEGPIDAEGKSRLPVEGKKLSLADISRLLFVRPNEIFSLGKTTDKPPFTLVNPMETWVIRGKKLHSKCGWTPYEGWTVTGRIKHES